MDRKIAFIILAAGQGTRMKSSLPKVLHKIDGKSMIGFVVESAQKVTKNNIIVVVGYKAKLVKENLNNKEITFAFQKEINGTASAVKTAIPFLKSSVEDVVVLCGDVPLISSTSLESIISEHRKSKNSVTTLVVEMDDPTGYGRIILGQDNEFLAIVEEKDATKEEKKIKIINAGIYCIEKDFLLSSIESIKNNNRQKEYYLTDIIKIGREQGRKSGIVISKNRDEFIGINTQEELNRVRMFKNIEQERGLHGHSKKA